MDAIIKESVIDSMHLDNRVAWARIYEFFISREFTPAAANAARAQAWEIRRGMRHVNKVAETAAPVTAADDVPELPPVGLSDVLGEMPEPVPVKAERSKIGFGLPGQKWGLQSLY